MNNYSPSLLTAVLVALSGLSLAPCSRAAVLRVDASASQPAYHSIQAALNDASAGDTVLVVAGVYRERVHFVHSGRKGAPVVLEGESEAIIDGSTPVDLVWSSAADVGPDVYRAPLDFFPFTVTADGKTITTLDEKRTGESDGPAPDHGWKRILWREAFVKGIGPSGWDGVKALAMYRHAEKDLLICFRGGLDPRGMRITVAPREPVVRISGVDRCVVRGLTLRNSAIGVQIERSLGSVVERCEIDPADFGVSLESGADRCTVRYNRIALSPYAGANPWGIGAWDNWQAMKVGGFYDRAGIAIGSSIGGHQIHDNYIHDHWDGISDNGNPPWAKTPSPTANTGLRVHHNYLFNLSDDAVETMGPGIDCEWHDNRIERALCGFRIKAPQKGPLYVYRNIFFANKEDLRNWGTDRQHYPNAAVWIYHNTSTSDAAINLNYGPAPMFAVAPGYHYFNNLFWCREWVRKNRPTLATDWQGDHNVYLRVSPSHPRPWSRSSDNNPVEDNTSLWETGRETARQAGLDAHSTWAEGDNPGFTDGAHYDVSLTTDSPARAAAADPTTLRDTPLPGLTPGYFQAGQPDAGALQFGQPMPRLPRDPDSVDEEPAGFWP
ncbi:MAG: hypothetical protein WC205_03815 [Opitutaceae bacterium]|jgi:hypothetical protein